MTETDHSTNILAVAYAIVEHGSEAHEILAEHVPADRAGCIAFVRAWRTLYAEQSEAVREQKRLRRTGTDESRSTAQYWRQHHRIKARALMEVRSAFTVLVKERIASERAAA